MLGIHVEVYCDSDMAYAAEVRHVFHWTRNTWQQGPRLTKAANITVEASTFTGNLRQVFIS